MIKKLLVILLSLFLITGCNKNINSLTLEEIINAELEDKIDSSNVNNRGYKYYLPNGFSVSNDKQFTQELLSNNRKYYMNVDVVCYYYKNEILTTHELDDFAYYTFEHDDKTGYLRIVKNNDYFFVELCYNYAIIEVEVEESELRYAVSHGIMILNSIKYNDLIIEKYINDNDIETSETVYNIPEPKEKITKNILEYFVEDEEEDED